MAIYFYLSPPPKKENTFKLFEILFCIIARFIKAWRGALTVVVMVVHKGEGWPYEKHFDIALLMRESVQSERNRATAERSVNRLSEKKVQGHFHPL